MTTTDIAQLTVQRVPMRDLTPAPYNPRVALQPGDPEYEALKRSFQQFGYVDGIVWNRRTGHVVGGHQRLTVLRELGVGDDDNVDVQVVDLDDDDERALNVALNKITGRWDDAQLATLLQHLRASGKLERTGFDDSELQALLQRVGQGVADGQTDPDDVPQPPDEPVTRQGDLIILGEHRLLCGDATKAADRDHLLIASSVEMILTSPPYDVGIAYRTHRDRMDGAYLDFIRSVFRTWLPSLKDGCAAVWNVGVSKNTKPHKQFVMLEEAGLNHWRTLVWKKPGVVVPGTNTDRARRWSPGYRYELIGVFSKGKPELGCAVVLAEAGTDVLEISVRAAHEGLRDPELPRKPNASHHRYPRSGKIPEPSAHPAPFPVALPSYFLARLTARGETVVDMFGGGGTTLIAAEQTGRRAFLMEIDPVYCDVIVHRWEKFTGKKAERVKRESV